LISWLKRTHHHDRTCINSTDEWPSNHVGSLTKKLALAREIPQERYWLNEKGKPAATMRESEAVSKDEQEQVFPASVHAMRPEIENATTATAHPNRSHVSTSYPQHDDSKVGP
jgi:hypothetical protein